MSIIFRPRPFKWGGGGGGDHYRIYKSLSLSPIYWPPWLRWLGVKNQSPRVCVSVSVCVCVYILIISVFLANWLTWQLHISPESCSWHFILVISRSVIYSSMLFSFVSLRLLTELPLSCFCLFVCLFFFFFSSFISFWDMLSNVSEALSTKIA